MSWRPVMGPKSVVALYLGIGIIFIPIGVALINTSNSVVEAESEDYSTACCVAHCDSEDSRLRVDRNPCEFNITVTETMVQPIYMYYKLTNFYQNNRRYISSRSDQQMRGHDTTMKALDTDCDGFYHQIPRPTPPPADERNLQISPCGLVARSYFNDSFMLLDSSLEPVPALTEKGIAWESDIDTKFGNSVNGRTGQNFAPFYHERQQSCSSLVADPVQLAKCHEANMPQAGLCYPGSGRCVEDEHFMVWMRTAALSHFRKVYAKIESDLQPGTYIVRVSNGLLSIDYPYYFNPSMSTGYYADPTTPPVNQSFLYPVAQFGGTKSIVLSTKTSFGGKNPFLGWCYLVLGVVCIVLALAFVAKLKMSYRPMGSATFVSKNK